MKKKGFTDKIIILMVMAVVLISLVLIVFVGQLFLPILISTTQTTGTILTDTFATSGDTNLIAANEVSFVPAAQSLNNLEWISYTIFICLFLVFLVMCFYVRTYPFLLFVWIILILVLLALSFYLAVVYQDMRLDSTLGTYYQSWENTDYMLQYLPVIVIFMGVIGGIIMGVISAKEGGGEESQTGI